MGSISHMKKWTPFVRIDKTTRPDWAQKWLDEHPDQQDDECYQNSRYQVLIKYIAAKDENSPPLIHLSIRSLDRTAQHDWRDFQRIKTEILGPEEEAIELYPAESRMVDGSNQYHLWCIKGFKWPFGFNERLVTNVALPGAVQRPFDDPPEDCIKSKDKLYELLITNKLREEPTK